MFILNLLIAGIPAREADSLQGGMVIPPEAELTPITPLLREATHPIVELTPIIALRKEAIPLEAAANVVVTQKDHHLVEGTKKINIKGVRMDAFSLKQHLVASQAYIF